MLGIGIKHSTHRLLYGFGRSWFRLRKTFGWRPEALQDSDYFPVSSARNCVRSSLAIPVWPEEVTSVLKMSLTVLGYLAVLKIGGSYLTLISGVCALSLFWFRLPGSQLDALAKYVVLKRNGAWRSLLVIPALGWRPATIPPLLSWGHQYLGLARGVYYLA